MQVTILTTPHPETDILQGSVSIRGDSPGGLSREKTAKSATSKPSSPKTVTIREPKSHRQRVIHG